MANVQRLTERVKKMEEWVKENEMMGGPAGTLETFNFLINEARMSGNVRSQMEQQMNNLRGLTFEFIQQHELTEEWDEFVKEKEDAVQKQQTEEIPVQEEAESSEEAVEASEKEE
jgi:hypothetical protein